MMDCARLQSSTDLETFLFAQIDPKWHLPCCVRHNKGEGFLIDHCLPTIAGEAQRFASDAPRVLRCTTVLTRITAILIESSHFLPLSAQCLLLGHCLQFLDFPSGESIGYQSVSLLTNLIQLHVTRCSQCQSASDVCGWLLNLGHALTGFGDQRELLTKIRIKALLGLLQCPSIASNVGALWEELLTDNFILRLYDQIKQPSLSIQVSKLIVEDICFSLRRKSNHSAATTRLKLHNDSILRHLVSEYPSLRNAIEQKLLPALTKVPESRNWFGSQFSSFVSHLLSPPSSLLSPIHLRGICTLLRLAIAQSDDHTLGWEDFLGTFSDKGEELLKMALSSGDVDCQLSALSLICSHPRGARPVSVLELRLVHLFVASNFSQPSPAVRQQIITHIGKLFVRVREHSKSMLKMSTDHLHLGEYRQFIRSLRQMAFDNLPASSTVLTDAVGPCFEGEEECEGKEERPSFSERQFALSLLASLTHLGEEFSQDSFIRTIGPSELSALLAELDDPFELCEETALNLLNRLFPTVEFPMDRLATELEFNLHAYFVQTKTELLFAIPFGPRHQQATHYRLGFILPRLSSKVRLSFAGGLLDLGKQICDRAENEDNHKILSTLAEKEGPNPQLHAVLSALLTSLPFLPLFETETGTSAGGDLGPLVDSLLWLCHRSAKLISPVVHSLSPEGFLPGDGSSEPGTDRDRASLAPPLSKICWRAHKAISHIFAHLVQRMPFPGNENSLSADQLSRIGAHFWLELTECRHCGAFEAAADAFRSICLRFWAFSSSPNFPCAPNEWLERIVAEMTGKSVSLRPSYLCPTRRSAGLPHLVSALLCTEPTADGLQRRHFPHFHLSMQQLLLCRSLQDPELEVHCVNVLRLLFAQATLSERALPHVESAFLCALEGCAVDQWPVRNAHVQLFAALIKRVFGTPHLQQRSVHIQPRCKMSAHEFFTRHPKLYRLVGVRLSELCSAIGPSPWLSSGDFFSAFPLLILLSHLRPVAHSQGQRHSLRPFLPDLLHISLQIPVRALRELASAALLSCATIAELERIVNWLSRMVQQPAFDPPSNFSDAIHTILLHIAELQLPELLGIESLQKLDDFVRLRLGKEQDRTANPQFLLYSESSLPESSAAGVLFDDSDR